MLEVHKPGQAKLKRETIRDKQIVKRLLLSWMRGNLLLFSRGRSIFLLY